MLEILEVSGGVGDDHKMRVSFYKLPKRSPEITHFTNTKQTLKLTFP